MSCLVAVMTRNQLKLLSARGIVVPYVLNASYVWGKYAYFNVFYNVNEFYAFHQELLHSADELPAENSRYINGDTSENK